MSKNENIQTARAFLEHLEKSLETQKAMMGTDNIKLYSSFIMRVYLYVKGVLFMCWIFRALLYRYENDAAMPLKRIFEIAEELSSYCDHKDEYKDLARCVEKILKGESVEKLSFSVPLFTVEDIQKERLGEGNV